MPKKEMNDKEFNEIENYRALVWRKNSLFLKWLRRNLLIFPDNNHDPNQIHRSKQIKIRIRDCVHCVC